MSFILYFNKDTVKKVVEELQSNEGGDIPTEINGESLAEPTYVTWTVHTPRNTRQPAMVPGQTSIFDTPVSGDTSSVSHVTAAPTSDNSSLPSHTRSALTVESTMPEYDPPMTVTVPAPSTPNTPLFTPPAPGRQLTIKTDIDRVEIIDFINAQGYLTYFIRHDRINDYLKSLLDLADLLTHNLIYQNARDEVIDDVLGLIRTYVDELHRTGKYEEFAKQVLEFKLSIQVFDPFGRALGDNYLDDFTMMSESDIDRRVRDADTKLGRYGFPSKYGYLYYDEDDPNAYKIDCVLFANNDDCRAKLGDYAKKKLNDFSKKYRIAIVSKSDACKKKYHDIMADSDVISEQIFAIPENISVREDADGTEYDNHLLASPKNGIAKIKLNGWESSLIEEEARRNDFVCWLRNPSRGTWALCLPYEIGGEKKAFYPDFLVVRSDPYAEYVVDILEPHGNQYADNLPKAKALADYAKNENRIGRIQLIHKNPNAGGSNFVRLDLTDIVVRDKVLHAMTPDELDHIFDTDGITE